MGRPTPADVPGEWSMREKWQRAQACCASSPRCGLCPLRPEHAHVSLKELALLGLEQESLRRRDPA